MCCFFFFFQAEDGIRDTSVTGVQTCALPISFHFRLFLEDGAHPRDVTAHYFELAAVGELLRRFLHTQAELSSQQLLELLGKLRRILGAEFTGLHGHAPCPTLTPSDGTRKSCEVEAWPRPGQTLPAPSARPLRPFRRAPCPA